MLAEFVLYDLIDELGWRPIPKVVITREGAEIKTISSNWHIPLVSNGGEVLRFSRIRHPMLRWAVEQYTVHRLETVSMNAGWKAFNTLARTLGIDSNAPQSLADLVDFKEPLIDYVEQLIREARAEHKMWTLWEVIQWYVWCSERYPELGFCPAYGLELDSMPIPGGPKGEAVRSLDATLGPLHRALELPLVIDALKHDEGRRFEHLQQRAAIALSLALGRNPANLSYLRNTDFRDLTPDGPTRGYVVDMPRIKKRQLDPRDDLITEYISPDLARYVLELVAENSTRNLYVDIVKWDAAYKPMFISSRRNNAALNAKYHQYFFHMTSADICDLIKDFAERHKIISPITREPLRLTPRRLRYTLATNLAAEGVSKQELARILDHSDTQNVHVYYEMAGQIVEHLDKATAKAFSQYLNAFKGRPVSSDENAVNGARLDKRLAYIDEENPEQKADIGVCGETDLCHQDPPYSCYLCPKFQPYLSADHEQVLESLVSARDRRLNELHQKRLGVQLDQVIYAVAQVTLICEERRKNG